VCERDDSHKKKAANPAMSDILKPPYTFHSLRAARRGAVIDQINERLALFETVGGLDRPPHAVAAQLLIQELGRRSQDHQTRIMIWCTIVVTVMTAVITVMTAVSTYPVARSLWPLLD
jgi:hypothetical protein